MEHATIDLLYNEIKHLRKDVDELRAVFIPEEEISEEERKELRALFKEIEGGKGKSWREVSKG